MEATAASRASGAADSSSSPKQEANRDTGERRDPDRFPGPLAHQIIAAGERLSRLATHLLGAVRERRLGGGEGRLDVGPQARQFRIGCVGNAAHQLFDVGDHAADLILGALAPPAGALTRLAVQPAALLVYLAVQVVECVLHHHTSRILAYSSSSSSSRRVSSGSRCGGGLPPGACGCECCGSRSGFAGVPDPSSRSSFCCLIAVIEGPPGR